MAHVFELHRESLKRKFSVYVVVAKNDKEMLLYVGKTGDNNLGCNPVISRCGNHFSYNSAHSQIRNKIIEDHENRDYTYIFEHFNEYSEEPITRRGYIDHINEMERWLNQEIAQLIQGARDVELLNKLGGKYRLSRIETQRRQAFRTIENGVKIKTVVEEVRKQLAASGYSP